MHLSFHFSYIVTVTYTVTIERLLHKTEAVLGALKIDEIE